MEADQECLALYGRELASAKLENDILDVPSGFLGDPSLPPLWLHPNYEFLEEFIEKSLASRNEPAAEASRKVRKRVRRISFHLVGTPGIGKSYFGLYWFYKQAKAGNKVIWREKGDDRRFLYYDFSLSEPLVHVSEGYVSSQAWQWVWLVIDGESKGIPQHRGSILQCVSPGRSGYHEASKDTGVYCYLEAWSLDELKACRDALQLGFDDEKLQERFGVCGGLPRLVFDELKTTVQLKDEMNSAVSRCMDWKAVIRHAAGDGDKREDISDFLLHYRLPEQEDLNEPYRRVTRKELIFGSDYIEEMVCDLYDRQGFEAARDFFDFCQEIPAAQALAGKFFERYIHKQMKSGGGEYKIKSLDGTSCESTISLKPSQVKRLKRWVITRDIPVEERGTGAGRRRKQVEKAGYNVYEGSVSRAEAEKSGTEISGGLASVPANCFIEPYSAVQKSFDSLLTPTIIFQETVSKDHKLFWSAIWEIIQEYDAWHRKNGFPKPDFYKLLFLVPESKFDGYRFQAYKKDDGSSYQIKLQEMSRVRQFAVEFPWKQ